MTHKVLVITQNEFALGFQLAQVATYPVKNSQEAKSKLQEQINSKEYGIILIDEELTKNFDDKLKKTIFASDLPLIMPVPLKKEFKEKPAEDEFAEFIRSAIGFRIRIK